MDETELIQQARQGECAAVEALYRRHSARVFAVVRRLAGDDALAEDWAQEAWIRALRALPGFRGEAGFGTWLHRIAVNSALASRRGGERRDRREGAAAVSISSGGSDEQTLLRIRLERAMDRLPEGMRRVLVLHDVEGFTHEEIADMLGVAPGTCKSQLWKARARMRELLRPAKKTTEEEPCRT